jgi:2-C-methyl-D-erythritol 4-phosphate cytidylyltransferase
MNAQAKPKQFLELNGKAIIIHTLEHFEQHPQIDAICIVCLESHIEYLKDLLKYHHIKKVKWIAKGGETGQQSIYNGLLAISENLNDDDSIVLIHDGVRPLINDDLITNCISTTREFGNAITMTPAIETIITAGEGNQIADIADRSACRLARAPQCFFLKDIFEAHKKALLENKTDFIDSAYLMKHYGHSLFMVEGPVENIKITTPMDYYLFRAIYEARENEQIIGV